MAHSRGANVIAKVGGDTDDEFQTGAAANCRESQPPW
jgi:hypothetical protein